MPNVVPKEGETGAAAAAASSPAKPLNTSANKKRYGSILRDFMQYTNQRTMAQPYLGSHVFSDEELMKITPDHIIKYFRFRLYGDGDTTNPDKPPNGSHHTLGKYKIILASWNSCTTYINIRQIIFLSLFYITDYYKKAISSFMPHREATWDDEKKQGNPTRSKLVNNYIAKLRDGENGSAKKRTPKPHRSSAKKARVGPPIATAVGAENANVLMASILQKMHQQNASVVNYFGSLSTSIAQFKSSLEETNKSISAELERLNRVIQQPQLGLPSALQPVPVPVAATAAAAMPGASHSAAVAQLQEDYFYDHPDGSTRRAPPDWIFPHGTLLELYTLWHLGDPANRISPLKKFTLSDISFTGNRARMNLSEARCLVAVLDEEAAKAGKRISAKPSHSEIVELFRLGVNGLNIPLKTPGGRIRDIFRLKWTTLTKYKYSKASNDEADEEGNGGKKLAFNPAQAGDSEWLYEHDDGAKRRVPSTWTFPMVSLQDIYVLWNCKDEENMIMPMKTFTALDVSFLPKGNKNLNEVRGMMNIISNAATLKGHQIKAFMSKSEALACFSAGVDALNISPVTPQGKARDIGATKWQSASRYKQQSVEEKSV